MHTNDIEINLLVSAIQMRYGHDLSYYAKASLKRRVQQAVKRLEKNSISELIPLILHNSDNYYQLLNELSITVTEMYRDPEVFARIRTKVIPLLEGLPYIKIWHAGCASGEEVYSLAILLHEYNLLEGTLIYATDVNQQAINIAREGIYHKDLFESYAENYEKSGGKSHLSDYFIHSRFSSIKIKPFIKEKVVFARHDLTQEEEFSEVHMIMCRNVLMYFTRRYQDLIVKMFNKCLYNNGILCIGKHEALAKEEGYEQIDSEAKIFKYTTTKLSPDNDYPPEFINLHAKQLCRH